MIDKQTKERSVILTRDEVLEIVDGSLNTLVRWLKRQPGRDYHSPIPVTDTRSTWAFQKPSQGMETFIVHSPFGGIGTHLWGRETFWMAHDTDNPSGYAVIDCGPHIDCGVEYCATPPNPAAPNEPGYWWEAPPKGWNGEDYKGRGTQEFLPWPRFTKFSAAQMPRAASRILLGVQEVRCERAGDDSPYRWICTFKKLETEK